MVGVLEGDGRVGVCGGRGDSGIVGICGKRLLMSAAGDESVCGGRQLVIDSLVLRVETGGH